MKWSQLLGKFYRTTILDSLRNKFEGIKFDSIARFNPVPINLVLPYKDNSISIDFVAIEPANPKQVKYQYKLEGYDKDWSPQAITQPQYSAISQKAVILSN